MRRIFCDRCGDECRAFVSWKRGEEGVQPLGAVGDLSVITRDQSLLHLCTGPGNDCHSEFLNWLQRAEAAA